MIGAAACEHARRALRAQLCRQVAKSRAVTSTESSGARSGLLAFGTALDRLALIDDYLFLVRPRIAGHGPTLFEGGLPATRTLELISATPLRCGSVAMQYRRGR